MSTLFTISSIENVVFGMLTLSLGLAFVRLIIGPTAPDRVVALDLISVLTVAVMLVYTITTNETAFLDPAIVLALIGFLGIVAFARYLERRAQGD